MIKKSLVGAILVCILIIILYNGVSWYNLSKIQPTESDVQVLKDNLGDIQIKNEKDIIRIQNKLCDILEFKIYDPDQYKEIVIDSVFKRRMGICYDRSLILQKVFLYNKLIVTPIYLYYGGKYKGFLSPLNLFLSSLGSHNIFAFELNGKEYVLETSLRVDHLFTLDEYLKSGIMPSNTKYIRHLNNRNGTFISPSWLPDIY